MPKDVFRFRAGKQPPVLGAFITFDSMPMVEILAGIGFDYLAIDTQHAMMDPVSAGKLMYAIPQDVPVLVRVGSSEPAGIGKVLDFGADGVIVPMVNNGREAAAAVAACRYNPSGVRSFGPLRKHLGFDANALQERAACFVMIETVEGVENIREIVATPGLAGIYFGGGDLAVNMGLPVAASPTDPKLIAAAQRVAQAANEAGVVAATHGQSIQHWHEQAAAGFTMITLSGDRTYITRGATEMLKAGREIR
jgi:2-keto-3-deoxy-L-rhamnonate aldolase RhmA